MKTHGAKEVQPKAEPERDKMEPGPVTNVGPHSTPGTIYIYIIIINTLRNQIVFQMNIDEKPRIIRQQFN
jgi:hypothetical protein